MDWTKYVKYASNKQILPNEFRNIMENIIDSISNETLCFNKNIFIDNNNYDYLINNQIINELSNTISIDVNKLFEFYKKKCPFIQTSVLFSDQNDECSVFVKTDSVVDEEPLNVESYLIKLIDFKTLDNTTNSYSKIDYHYDDNSNILTFINVFNNGFFSLEYNSFVLSIAYRPQLECINKQDESKIVELLIYMIKYKTDLIKETDPNIINVYESIINTLKKKVSYNKEYLLQLDNNERKDNYL